MEEDMKRSFETEHKDLIHDVAFDYYGKTLATCSSDQTIKLWTLNNDRWDFMQSIDLKLHTHRAPIRHLSWCHPSFGSIIASCSSDRIVNIFQLIPVTKGAQSRGTHNNSSDDNSSNNNSNNNNNNNNNREFEFTRASQVIDFHATVNSIEFAPSHLGLKLAIVSLDGRIKIMDAPDISNLKNWSPSSEICIDKTVPKIYSYANEMASSSSSLSSNNSNNNVAFEQMEKDMGNRDILGKSRRIESQKCTQAYCLTWNQSRWECPTFAVGTNRSKIFIYCYTSHDIAHKMGYKRISSKNYHRYRNDNNNNNNTNHNNNAKQSLLHSSSNDSNYHGSHNNNNNDNIGGSSLLLPQGGSIKRHQSEGTNHHNHSGIGWFCVLAIDLSKQLTNENNNNNNNNNNSKNVKNFFNILTIDWAPHMARKYHLIAVGCSDGYLRIIKLYVKNLKNAYLSWQEIFSHKIENASKIWRVKWNLTGTMLLSASDDASVRLWKRNRFTDKWDCNILSQWDNNNNNNRNNNHSSNNSEKKMNENSFNNFNNNNNYSGNNNNNNNNKNENSNWNNGNNNGFYNSENNLNINDNNYFKSNNNNNNNNKNHSNNNNNNNNNNGNNNNIGNNNNNNNFSSFGGFAFNSNGNNNTGNQWTGFK